MKRLSQTLASLFLCLLTAAALADTGSDGATQTRTSSDGLYVVTVDSQLKPLQLGRMHAWTATVKTADGEPVTGATIKVGGGMPIHNHGFPTEPEVTSELEPGVYLIRGVKFSMRGPWVLYLDITADDQTDSVAFDIDL